MHARKVDERKRRSSININDLLWKALGLHRINGFHRINHHHGHNNYHQCSISYFLGHWTMSILLLWSSSQEVQVHSSTSASALGSASRSLCLSAFLPTRPLTLPQPLPSAWAIWMETSPCVPFDLLQAILCVAKCAAAAAASTAVCFARSSPLMACCCSCSCCCCVGIWGMKLKERKKVLLCESRAKEWWKNAIFYMKIFLNGLRRWNEV